MIRTDRKHWMKHLLLSQSDAWYSSVGSPKEDAMKQKADVPTGHGALMVLKTLELLAPLHGYGIATENRADQRRFAGCQSRHSVSSAAPVRTGRRNRIRMGRVGEQPP